MKNLNKIAVVLLMLSLFSCEDILNTEPNDRLTNETALSDYDGVVATLLGGYDRLRNTNSYYRRDFVVIAETLADNLKQTINNSSRLNGISGNAPYAHFFIWVQAYRVINSANFVISAIDNITDATQSQLDQVHAEALFLRALAHFDLVRVYARNPNFSVGEPLGIPIVTEIVSPTESFPERNTIDEVYAQIIADLNQAAGLVNTSISFPNRASASAIQALLARVHLYAGNWEEAITASTKVIDNVGFDIEKTDYKKIFSNQSETIFGISFLGDESPGLNGSLEGVLYVDPESGIGYGDFVARQDILNLYGPDDIRAALFTHTSKSGEEVDYVGKFIGYGGSFGLDHIPLIRLSEMYLTRAEALAELGTNLAGAISDLNYIRNRAGLPNTTASSQADVIDAVLQERRLELAFEGHRIFDLKRKGMDIPKGMSGVDCQGECSIPYTDFRVIANIPIAETDVNSNLKQNPGY